MQTEYNNKSLHDNSILWIDAYDFGTDSIQLYNYLIIANQKDSLARPGHLEEYLQ